MAWVNGADERIGNPSWERLGRTSGCANRRVVEVEPELWIDLKTALASSKVEMALSPILISHAPRIRVLQSLIFAAGVLGDIVARCRRPSHSSRLRPAVAWVAMSNFRRSSGCSNAS